MEKRAERTEDGDKSRDLTEDGEKTDRKDGLAQVRVAQLHHQMISESGVHVLPVLSILLVDAHEVVGGRCQQLRV